MSYYDLFAKVCVKASSILEFKELFEKNPAYAHDRKIDIS
jgi:hypothetical protein